jgi:hypothetical protein
LSDENETWKPILNEFADKLTGKLDSNLTVLRQLAFSSDLAAQISSQGKCNAFMSKILELVIIFVVIGRQVEFVTFICDNFRNTVKLVGKNAP